MARQIGTWTAWDSELLPSFVSQSPKNQTNRRFYFKDLVVRGVTDMKHYQSQQGVELTQYKLIKHFCTHLHTSNLRLERAKLTIRVQQTSNEFKSFHWNGTSVEIFLQLMENVFRFFTNSEFVNWFFYSMDPILLVLLKFFNGQLRVGILF